MKTIPSKWLTLDASWGEGHKHLWSKDAESLKFHTTEADARKHAEQEIRDSGGMVAICEVKMLLVPKPVEFDQIK